MRYWICQLNQIKEKTEKCKRGKIDVLIKVLRAKLTNTWEGGGVGAKKHTNTLFLVKLGHSYHYPHGEKG